MGYPQLSKDREESNLPGSFFLLPYFQLRCLPKVLDQLEPEYSKQISFLLPGSREDRKASHLL